VPQHVLKYFNELKEKKTFICVLEELGLAAPYFSPEVEGLLAGHDVLHFADNKAANSAIIKGGSAAPDMARIVAALHLRLARQRTRLWVEFVKSEANLADLPSRGEFALVRALGATPVPFTIPPFMGWSGD